MTKKRGGIHVSAYLEEKVKQKAEAQAAAEFLTLSGWFRKIIYRELGLAATGRPESPR